MYARDRACKREGEQICEVEAFVFQQMQASLLGDRLKTAEVVHAGVWIGIERRLRRGEGRTTAVLYSILF